jgi:transposase
MIKNVAKELQFDRKSVKGLEKRYMQVKLWRDGYSGPNVIGIDEITLRTGHIYNIVVSGLERRRPILFGEVDRSEESLNSF